MNERLRQQPEDALKVAEIAKYVPNWVFRADEQIAFFEPAREIVDVWKRNGEWRVGNYGMFKPILPIRETLRTSAERIAFVLSAVRRREHLMQRTKETYGNAPIQVRMGGLTPFELGISRYVQSGGTRFLLLEGKTYDSGDRLVLGFSDIDCFDETSLAVNLVQDDAVVRYEQSGDCVWTDTVDENGRVRSVATIASNRKKAIRRYMKTGRDVQPDLNERETPGVEEFVMYCMLEVLVASRAIKPNAALVIPVPEVTNGGEAEGGGTWQAIVKTLAAGFARKPHMLERIAGIMPEEWRKLGDAAGQPRSQAENVYLFAATEEEGIYRSLPIPSEGEKTLGSVLAGWLLEAVPEHRRPSQETLQSLGFFDDFPGGVDQWRRFIYAVAQRTPAYARTFHAYRTAFADVSEGHPWGRVVAREQLRKLPFAQEITIEFSQ